MAIAAELKAGVSFDTSKFEKSVDTIKETLDKLKDQWIADNKTYEEVYRDYHAAKEKLDNKSFKSFEEYEEAKTTVEAAENDSRLKSYTAYKDAEEAKNKQVLENTKKLAKTLTLSLTTPLVGLAGFGLKAASKIEDYTASFKTLLGTEPAAKKMIKTINEMAAATPFDPDPLIQSTEKLLAFGIEAENVNDVLNMLGDSSKGSAEALQTLSTAYGKVAAKGKASMEELNMMIDRGVPILGELANVMGVTENEVIKLTSEGKIGFNEVNKAFQNMTSEGGVFYKGMETASQTLSGKLSTLKGNISMLGASIMEEVLPTVKKMVDFANEAVKSWTNMGDGAKTAILSVGTALATIGPALGIVTKAADAWKKLAPIIKTVVPAIKGATTAQLAWNAAQMANPIMLAVAGVAALTAGLAVLAVRTSSAESKQKEFNKKVAKAKEATNEYIEALKEEASALDAVARKNAQQKHEETIKSARKEYEKMHKAETEAFIKYDDYSLNALGHTEKQKEALRETWQMAKNQVQEYEIATAKALLEAGLREEEVAKALDEITGKYKSHTQSVMTVEAAQKRITAELERQKKAEDDRIKAEQEAEKKRREAEENEKDGFVKAQEAYQKYIQNKEKLSSKLLTGNQRETLEAEQKTLEESYNAYQKYLDDKKAAEDKARQKEIDDEKKKNNEELKAKAGKIINLLAIDQDYALQAQQLDDNTIMSAEEKNDRLIALAQERAVIEHKLSKEGADDLKSLLVEMVANGETLTGELQKVYDMFFAVEKKSKDTSDGIVSDAEKAAAALSTISSAVGNVSSYINSSFEALSYTTSKLQPLINNAFGASTKSLMSNFATAASQISSIMNSDMPEGMKETQSALAGVVAGLQTVGDISNAVFGAVLDSIQADMDAINDELSKSIERIRAEQEATISEIDKNLKSKVGTEYEMGSIEKEKKAKLDALKEEFAERGVILETGYETELEKAQEAYQKSIDAYKEALDEYTELGNENEAYRNEQLELYKQALEGKTDKELEEALKNKEMELEKSAMLKNEERKRTAEEKLQEATRNKNLAEAEAQKQKILEDAEHAEVVAKIQAENAKAEADWKAEDEEVKAKNSANKALHDAETQAFYADMASQIANVWINAAAGTVAAWASCMPFGPIAGPILAGILTGTMMTVAGVQTGLIASQSPPQAPAIIAAPPRPELIPVPQFAEGVTAFRGGMALVGEEGPELVTLPQGSNVITNENTNDILQTLEDVLSGTGGDITVNVTCVIDGMEIPIKEQLIEIQRDEMYRSRR